MTMFSACRLANSSAATTRGPKATSNSRASEGAAGWAFPPAAFGLRSPQRRHGSSRTGSSVCRLHATARRGIGVAHVRYVIENCDAEPAQRGSGNIGLQWIGADDRGDVLEILGLELIDAQGEQFLLITHVMPHRYRREGSKK